MGLKKETRYKVIGKGNRCSGCNEIMERREHSETPKKTWHYTKWDICKNHNCSKSVQHYEEFKSIAWQLHESGLDEIDRQDNYMRNLK